MPSSVFHCVLYDQSSLNYLHFSFPFLSYKVLPTRGKASNTNKKFPGHRDLQYKNINACFKQCWEHDELSAQIKLDLVCKSSTV